MTPRPKRTKKDSNHAKIVRDLRDGGYTVIDVADLPGQERHNPLDLFVGRAGAPVIVVCSAAGLRRWMEAHPAAQWVQVEVKPDPHARFTDDELAYLAWCGWDGKVWR